MNRDSAIYGNHALLLFALFALTLLAYANSFHDQVVGGVYRPVTSVEYALACS
jgi:hypothetical protein